MKKFELSNEDVGYVDMALRKYTDVLSRQVVKEVPGSPMHKFRLDEIDRINRIRVLLK